MSEQNVEAAGAQGLIHELLDEMTGATREIVPHFLSSMPEAYFNDTDRESQKAHLKAIIAAKAGGLPQTLTLQSADGRRLTFVNERSYPGLLGELAQQLPDGLPLPTARVHTSRDGTLVLDVFEFGEPERALPEEIEAQLEAVVAEATAEGGSASRQAFAEHLAEASRDYVLHVSPVHIRRYAALVGRIRGSLDTAVELDRRSDEESVISVAFSHVRRRSMFERVTRLLGHYGLDIRRAYLDTFGERAGQPVCLLSLLVSGPDGAALSPELALWTHLRQDLSRLKYLDDDVLDLAASVPGLELSGAEVAVAVAHLIHQVLAPRNPYFFTRARILRSFSAHAEWLCGLVAAFRDKFVPTDSTPVQARAEALAPRLAELQGSAASCAADEDERAILDCALDAVRATQRCNLFLEARYALSLRVDSSFLQAKDREAVPHAVFFVHGRDFDGFHVRFRDIARGGLRVVRTLAAERHALESERLYDEAYGLAYAQQLKNKDIPEGGAKGVLLVRPEPHTQHWARSFADALLDLITPDPETRAKRVDYADSQDLIYLGPDENIDNDTIRWIVERAALRGYPLPNAFMSSKPGAGINHKEFGITSEGVTVFLEAGLQAIGIDPRAQPFTIKLTGGPDGDVAGNELRILHREYGDHARIVGVADGSGCAEDPQGLDHGELLRLVDANLPIAAFAPQKLSAHGRVLSVESPEGVVARNSLHNRLVADAFVPAGGRPQTVRADNWRAFLNGEGVPSSPLVVEGANLFFSGDARAALAEHGVLFVKDSSANKCGVICSSFEILASMLLSEEEFLAIKPRFVPEVIEKLRELSGLEAEMLFRERRHQPAVPLHQLSQRISRAILFASDAVADAVARLPEAELPLARWFLEKNLPPVLVEQGGARMVERLPPAYLCRAVGAMLASRIVYREGLAYFEHMAPRAVGRLALRYLTEEREVDGLVASVEASSLPQRERIARLLRHGGAGTALRAAIAEELGDADAPA